MWSTTATGEFDSMSAANDDAGTLGFHAAACKLANGGSRHVVETLRAMAGVLRPRLISVAVAVSLATAIAIWLLG